MRQSALIMMMTFAVIGCEADQMFDEGLSPLFDVQWSPDGDPMLPDSLANQLETLAQVDGGAEAHVNDYMGGNAHFTYWTQANNPLGFTPPRVRHDAHAEAFNPNMFWSGSYPGEFRLRVTGFEWDDEVLGWGCEDKPQLKLVVRTNHRARWHYMRHVPGLNWVLRLPERSKPGLSEAQCASEEPETTLVAGALDEGEGWIICQQWFWVNLITGQILDEWWECWEMET